MDITAIKISKNLLSKESTNSGLTQQKDFSDYLGKNDGSKKNGTNHFNRSDICMSKNYIEKQLQDTKKQTSFFKPKMEIKNTLECFTKKSKTLNSITKVTSSKITMNKIACSFTALRSSIFKPGKMNESSISSLRYQDLNKQQHNFKKKQPIEKKKNYLLTCQIMILIQNELFLSKFLKCFHNEEEIDDLFRNYTSWIENNDFQPILQILPDHALQSLYKVSLLYERMSFYICYFIYKQDFQKEEIIFLKKTAGYIYLNFIALIGDLKPFIPEVL